MFLFSNSTKIDQIISEKSFVVKTSATMETETLALLLDITTDYTEDRRNIDNFTNTVGIVHTLFESSSLSTSDKLRLFFQVISVHDYEYLEDWYGEDSGSSFFKGPDCERASNDFWDDIENFDLTKYDCTFDLRDLTNTTDSLTFHYVTILKLMRAMLSTEDLKQLHTKLQNMTIERLTDSARKRVEKGVDPTISNQNFHDELKTQTF